MTDVDPLYVTRPDLPPLEELVPLLEKIWESRTLSNDGQFHRQFEDALCRYLGVANICLVANATLGLILALRLIADEGEIITTPFSFVATSHAISLAGLQPVFVDVDKDSFNMNPSLIEAALSSHTRAILPVHCFGKSCDVNALSGIARDRNINLVYDAAHGFAVRDEGGSILRHGDMSVLSFHATKVFNTFEGGAIVCSRRETKLALDRLRNFGIEDQSTVSAVGLNAKMNEFSAALGLLQLDHIDSNVARRRDVVTRYRNGLEGLPGIRLASEPVGQTQNYYSFPILIDPQGRCTRDGLFHKLSSEGIHARRYFFPLISEMAPYRHVPSAKPANLPIAHQISDRILCLPTYPDLTESEQDRIIDTIDGFVHSGR